MEVIAMQEVNKNDVKGWIEIKSLLELEKLLNRRGELEKELEYVLHRIKELE